MAIKCYLTVPSQDLSRSLSTRAWFSVAVQIQQGVKHKRGRGLLQHWATCLSGLEADDEGSWMTPAQRAKAEIAAKAMAEKPVLPTEAHSHLINQAKRCAEIPRCTSAPGERPSRKSQQKKSQPAPAPKGDGAPASKSRADAGPSQQATHQAASKAEAPQRAPAGRSNSGQDSPRTRESKSQQASRAGGLRGVDGSGQTQGRGHVSPPSNPGS
jgi:hypothetical protein